MPHRALAIRRLAVLGAALCAGGGAPAAAEASAPEPAGERAAGPAEDADWSVFESEEGRFRVELPEEPRVERSERSTLLGAVEMTRFVLRLGEAEPVALAVEVHDIPRLAARVVPAGTILEQTREGVLREMGAEQVTASELTLGGHPARDFTYRVPPREAEAIDAPEAAPLYERAIAVLVGSRIYLVTGMAPGSPGAHPEIARFFASFRFWREGSEPPEPVIEPRD